VRRPAAEDLIKILLMGILGDLVAQVNDIEHKHTFFPECRYLHKAIMLPTLLIYTGTCLL